MLEAEGAGLAAMFVWGLHRDTAQRREIGIQCTETAQAERVRGGTSLREQLDFAGYRERQASDPELTLRRHLQERGGAIEI